MVAEQRLVAGLHREPLVIEPVGEVVAVGDAGAERDDQRRPIEGLRFLERMDGLRVMAPIATRAP